MCVGVRVCVCLYAYTHVHVSLCVCTCIFGGDRHHGGTSGAGKAYRWGWVGCVAGGGSIYNHNGIALRQARPLNGDSGTDVGGDRGREYLGGGFRRDDQLTPLTASEGRERVCTGKANTQQERPWIWSLCRHSHDAAAHHSQRLQCQLAGDSTGLSLCTTGRRRPGHGDRTNGIPGGGEETP